MAVTRQSVVAATGLMLAVSAARLGAQTIQGRVLLPDSSAGVAGVLVNVVDQQGAIVGHALSSPDGGFRIGSLRPGSFSLRGMRIGYSPTTLPFAIRDSGVVRLDLILKPLPAELPRVETRADRRCNISGDESAVVLSYVQRARAFADAAHQSFDPTALRAHVLQLRGTMDVDRTHIDVDSSDATELITNGQVSDASTDSLIASGFYSRVVGHSPSAYTIPRPDIILDDKFLATHCFHVVRGAKADSQLVGLGFSPIDRRSNYADVVGTLWVGKDHPAPRRLDFKFVNIPHERIVACDSMVAGVGVLCAKMDSGSDAGGTVEFAEATTGEWFASQWTLEPGVVAAKYRELRRYRGRGSDVTECAGGPGCNAVSGLVPRLGRITFSVATLARDGFEIYHNEAARRLIARNAKRGAGGHPANVQGGGVDSSGSPVAGDSPPEVAARPARIPRHSTWRDHRRRY